MSDQAQRSYHGVELLRAAAAATERAPQLADEIRLLTQALARRVSAGEHLSAHDVDVRTLVSLIEQSGTQVPASRA